MRYFVRARQRRGSQPAPPLIDQPRCQTDDKIPSDNAAAGEPLDLAADERTALIRLLQDTVENARFPYAPRLAPLKAILEKLVPPKPPQAKPLLPLKVGMGTTHGQ